MYTRLHLPHSCDCFEPIYKKALLERNVFSVADKKLMKRISHISWIYCLKPDTINIQAFKNELREYSEIQFIEVQLNEHFGEVFKDSDLQRISEIIMWTIPYPVIIVMLLKGQIQFWASHSRNNLIDPNGAIVLEEFVSTGWLDESTTFWDRVSIEKMKTGNLFDLYSNYVDEILLFNAWKHGIKDVGKTPLTANKAKRLLERLYALELEKTRLINAVKAETQFNKKAEMNIQIKLIEKEIEKIRE